MIGNPDMSPEDLNLALSAELGRKRDRIAELEAQLAEAKEKYHALFQASEVEAGKLQAEIERLRAVVAARDKAIKHLLQWCEEYAGHVPGVQEHATRIRAALDPEATKR